MYKIARSESSLIGDIIVDAATRIGNASVRNTSKFITWLTRGRKKGLFNPIEIALMGAIPFTTAYLLTSASRGTLEKNIDPKYKFRYRPGYVHK